MSIIKHTINKLHPTIFSHQVGWFDGKGVDICPWGLRLKLQSDIIVVNNGLLALYTLHNKAF
jgi:hypothetical protein